MAVQLQLSWRSVLTAWLDVLKCKHPRARMQVHTESCLESSSRILLEASLRRPADLHSLYRLRLHFQARAGAATLSSDSLFRTDVLMSDGFP